MITARATVLSGLVLASLALAGCDNSSNPSGGSKAPTNTGGPTSIYGKSAQMGKDAKQGIEQASEQANQAAAAMTGEKGIEIAGLRWAIPQGWEKVATTSPMRVAEYKAGEGGAASVRFFAIGGGAEQNISRWRGQVASPVVTPENKTINAGNLKISIFKATGTYSGMGPSNAPTAPAENTRFLGAYIEGGPQPVQVVLIGPDAAVKGDLEKAWELMLSGVQGK